MERIATPKPYQSAPRLVLALNMLFVCIMIMNALSIATTITGIICSAATENPNPDSSGTAGFFDLLITLITAVEILLFVVTGLVFIPWFTRIRQNAQALGITGLKSTVSDCIAAFLIPIINLFKPYKIAQELWKSSSEDALTSDWSNTKSSPVIKWWWFFWITFTILGRVADGISRSLKPDASPNMALLVCVLSMSSDAASFVAAFLALKFVRKLTQRQEKQHLLFVETAKSIREMDDSLPQIIN